MSENEIMGLDAYAFEPEYSEEELRHRSIDIDETSSINVLDVPVSEWCTCENCQIMDTAEECICCAGCEYVHPNIEDNTCITEHSLFELIVCNPDVLAVAFIQIMIYKGQRGRAPEHLSNKQLRLTAYRQFVCWMFRGEKLGKGKRVVIPSCVVMTIRKRFPDPTGDYTGFRSALDSIHDLYTEGS